MSATTTDGTALKRPPRGARRHVVAIQTPTRTSDGAGGFTESMSTLSPTTAFAKIDTATARDVERVFGAKVQMPVTHVVTLDYHSGLAASARKADAQVVFGSRTFRVRAIANPEERNIDHVLACEEIL